MIDKKSGAAGIQSIQRAISILRSFSEAEPELSVTELSRRLNLHKSTVSRILSTLQQETLVSQNSQTGKYRLGLGLVSLAGVALGKIDVRGVAQPYLDTLVEVSQETVNVSVLDRNECINVERLPSPQPIRYMGWIGRRTPLHCTAGGKVFLAFMKPEERATILPHTLRRYTEKTITDVLLLEESLAQIRKQGFAIVHQEFEEGFSSIAAPIYNHSNQAIATVSISGPTYRMEPERIETFIAPLRQVTQKISGELGYRGEWEKPAV